MAPLCNLFSLLLFIFSIDLSLSGPVQTTYLWHLEQPIYWPAAKLDDSQHYQKAYDSIQSKSQQGGHPEQDLDGIFSKDDRVAVYQYRAVDSIKTCSDVADMGAQVSYSGGLIENVQSLAIHNRDGYSPGWNGTYTSGTKNLKTSSGFTKLDLVGFSHHHALIPFIDSTTLDKEIGIHKVLYSKTWGGAPYSKGFFPSEMSFSERNIPTLVKNGIQWVIVSNSHLSRACQNYAYSPSGDNNDPPNPSEILNPSSSHWYKESISRGCTPNNAVPFAYTPHYAKYVDPNTAQESKIVVVPAAQAMSWDDGYACYGTGAIDSIAQYNDPTHPMLILLAHDGDNDFGGGYTYYMECVSNFVHQAKSHGYNPTTIQQYLHDYPVDPNDIVKVEDGPWVNADGDFGSPQFINWNYPLTGNQTYPNQFDIPNGWQLDERNWAVITAAQNYVETAEQMAGGVRLSEIQDPTSSVTEAELAWHYFLPGLNSGFMYYGSSEDMPDKPTVACNLAIQHASNEINASRVSDVTAPSVWYLMRVPYNPGGYGAGSLWSYRYTQVSNVFYIYTFVYDLSGVKGVTLYYRVDDDKVNPLNDNANEVFNPAAHGLSGVGPWVALSMTRRPFPPGDAQGIHFDYYPTEIADEYYVQITQLKDVLIDYYVEAKDTYGNTKITDIYHVYIGTNTETKPVSFREPIPVK